MREYDGRRQTGYRNDDAGNKHWYHNRAPILFLWFIQQCAHIVFRQGRLFLPRCIEEFV